MPSRTLSERKESNGAAGNLPLALIAAEKGDVVGRGSYFASWLVAAGFWPVGYKAALSVFYAGSLDY